MDLDCTSVFDSVRLSLEGAADDSVVNTDAINTNTF